MRAGLGRLAGFARALLLAGVIALLAQAAGARLQIPPDEDPDLAPGVVHRVAALRLRPVEGRQAGHGHLDGGREALLHQLPGRLALQPEAVDRDALDHAELDERDDGDLGVGDLGERLPHSLGQRRAHRHEVS